ncbi:MAG: S8 family serine peptidase [Deltaproteobacteria bacterium]|nr:S8 family serine peptidase [Deltaproteobacteria bacterium]
MRDLCAFLRNGFFLLIAVASYTDNVVCLSPFVNKESRFQTLNINGIKAKSLGFGYFTVKTALNPVFISLLTRGQCENNHRYYRISEPNDEYWYSLSPIFRSINGKNAWRLSGLKRAYVAVIDTGVDIFHPDLAGRVDTDLAYNATTDEDNLIKDVSDPDGHGTHVAGIVAARANNGIGGLGISKNAKIIPVKVLDQEGNIYLSYVLDAYIYVSLLRDAKLPVRVINISLGSPGYSDLEKNLLKELERRGVIVVAAAGNESEDFDTYPIYPAGYKLVNVTSVGSGFYDPDTKTGSLSSFSNYGQGVKIIAPGDEILSTIPANQYAVLSGTSMATPFVAGGFALYFGLKPKATVKEAMFNLLNSCRKVKELKPYAKNGCYLDVNKFVKKAAQKPKNKR